MRFAISLLMAAACFGQGIFSGGAQVLRSVQCASGTVSYTSLTAASATQEITIQTGIQGNVRWDQVMVSETTKFAGTFTALTVSMGRPGLTKQL